jgi:hypothetical protein
MSPVFIIVGWEKLNCTDFCIFGEKYSHVNVETYEILATPHHLKLYPLGH